MLQVPDNLTNADLAFGNIKHMPKFDTLPEDFRRNWHSDSQPFCRAISTWFHRGAERLPNGNGLEIGGVKFVAKHGVDANKALAAIRSVMASWDPKHEHKIAACGYMLDQWFERKAS